MLKGALQPVQVDVINWISYGEHGLSSAAILWYFTGIWVLGRDGVFGHPAVEPLYFREHPHDPSDLRRCVELLDMVPSFRERLHEMADVSPSWARLVKHWAKLESLLREEMAVGKTAPKTYVMMKAVLAGKGVS